MTQWWRALSRLRCTANPKAVEPDPSADAEKAQALVRERERDARVQKLHSTIKRLLTPEERASAQWLRDQAELYARRGRKDS